MIDALKEVNLGVVEDPKPTYVSASLTGDEESKYIELLKEFKDQAQRRFRPEPVPMIETEVNKLIEDEFPLHICELMIDATTGYEAMFFMDGSSRYNQIRMALKDEELTAFRVYTTTRNAFERIKSYLMKPPVLAAPIPGKPLILYISAHERLVGELLAQGNNEGKENALYYLSRMMAPNDLKYSPIEKLCLALVISIQKLKHYFQAHIVRLVSRANPIKFVMSKPVLSNRLARWYLQFQQFGIVYAPQKAVKGQALADFLECHPILDDWELSDELSDEDAMVIEIQPPWKMYFDGAAHRERDGAGLVFITSQGEVLPYSFTLTQRCSNNVFEYQTLIFGLEMALDIKKLQQQVFGDSKLVINHILGSYKVKKPELVPYHKYAQILVSWLGEVTIQHVPRKGNKRADALAALASTLSFPDQT
ncbi:uncharacterized protein [Nicotiana tomentosiformis]|uniref:uncharacterized protein n=1 Tax=Nicotiana tomentosiformis TaxID=4098 RepID=UPI00388C5F76